METLGSQNTIIWVASNGSTVHVDDVTSPAPSLGLPPVNYEENTAVSVRNGYKGYGKRAPVLKDFNMTVPQGIIYSFLGSSGCGKTTMLSCVVGINRLDKGEILVFGHKPGTKASCIPGRRVGYMPQELAVYDLLTIMESLYFFGRIYGMQRDEMLESTKFLVDFLDLPAATRRVGTLSGGQKRRVSLALALIHDPELLILDEPTVGVDPLLRESIWKHLLKLVTSRRTTVIITTHYVEEARQSNVVGIMRNGRLLTEKSPEALLQEFKTSLLEDIVLSLSRMDREERRKTNGQDKERQNENAKDKDGTLEEERSASTFTIRTQTGHTELGGLEEGAVIRLRHASSLSKSENGDEAGKGNGNVDISSSPIPQFLLRQRKAPGENKQKKDSTIFNRLVALLIKNCIILMRNVGFLMFIFFVPTSQMILICLTIGSDPRGLELGVVNPESCNFEGTNWRRKIIETCPIDQSGDLGEKAMLSCFYLAHLPVDSFILQREASQSTALNRIEKGYTYGYIEFPESFTENVICKFAGLCSDDASVKANIILELDMSNKHIGLTMKRIFIETYVVTMERIKDNCKSSVSEDTLETAANIPYTVIKLKKPVYGKDDISFKEYLAPSVLLGFLFFFPLCSSGVSYIADKKIGTLDRSLVAGVGTTELMGGFLISQVGILLGQSGIAFLILITVYKIQVIGSIFEAVALTILVGICGMSFGFLIAMFCSDEVHVVYIAIGTFFPNTLLAGMIWPLEGLPVYLQYASYLVPCTLACESMRSIVTRGWTLTHRGVWPGFISTFGWIVVYWISAILVSRRKNKG